MNNRNIKTSIILLLGLFLFSTNSNSQNPNFHIYLCFGQSNMEGQGNIEAQDNTVDERFKVLQSLNCSGKSDSTWRTAIPPLCQCDSKLSPADFFGKTMVANLPDSITVGVINVAVGGCDIRLFDKDIYMDYDSTYVEKWFLDKVKDYGGNPYQHLINLARFAQQDGVVKGILLHQGETNTGDSNWPTYVKKIYNDMLADLSLDAEDVPLLAGEVVHADQGGGSASMNTIIDRLPDTISTAYVIPSNGCTKQDEYHFNSAGYRELGRRYAMTMLSILEKEVTYGNGTANLFYEAECGNVGENWALISNSGASNDVVATVRQGIQSLDTPPTDDASIISLSFNIEKAGYFDVFARVRPANTDQDAFWIKVDNGTYEKIEIGRSVPWKWVKVASSELSAGEHMLYVGLCEEGFFLDKICISDFLYMPSEIGESAENECVVTNISVLKNDVSLGQNYPNPFTGKTVIPFEISNNSYVSLKVFTMEGAEIIELAGKEFSSGSYEVEFDSGNLPVGKYFYTLKTDNYSASKEMIIK